MNKIGVETTQHVQLHYTAAGVGERIVAYLIDGFAIVAYYLLIVFAFSFFVQNDLLSPAAGIENAWVFVAVLLIPVFLYYPVSEMLWNGKTIGKWAVGIQVVKTDGTAPGAGSYLIRWAFRLIEISATGGMLAFITILINGKGQRLGDIVARTCVIKTRKKVSLQETIYAATNPDYTPQYPRVKLLSDKDITLIKEVLAASENYDRSTWLLHIEKTSTLIQKRLGVENSSGNGVDFLKKIISDYNYYFGADHSL